MKKMLVFSMLLVFGVVGSASANLLTNGGFESGNLDGWSSSCNVNVQTADLFNNFTPFEGDYMAVLATHLGGADAWLEQDFNADLFPGFTLSFAYNLQALDTTRWLDCGDDTLSVTVSADIGSYELMSETIDDPFGDGTTVLGWQTYSKTFYLPPFPLGDIGINFNWENWSLLGSGGDPGQFAAAYIDAVSVKPVPEPATMLLLGSGLIGLAGFGRKKLRKK